MTLELSVPKDHLLRLIDQHIRFDFIRKETNMQALTILGTFSENSHIDPDLLEVSMEGAVCQKYAERFIDSSQIDVQISK